MTLLPSPLAEFFQRLSEKSRRLDFLALALLLALTGCDDPSADLPTGPAPAGPTAFAPPSGSGGGGGEELVDVPNVIGLTLEQAITTIIGADLVVGNVTIQGQQTGSLMDTIVRPAHASEEPKCCVQDPVACEICVEPGTSVDMVFCPEAAAIPEPSTLALFATGLGLLVLIAWRWRRRQRA